MALKHALFRASRAPHDLRDGRRQADSFQHNILAVAESDIWVRDHLRQQKCKLKLHQRGHITLVRGGGDCRTGHQPLDQEEIRGTSPQGQRRKTDLLQFLVDLCRLLGRWILKHDRHAVDRDEEGRRRLLAAKRSRAVRRARRTIIDRR